MQRLVIDTNLFVSALLSREGAPARVIDAWRARKFLVITSEAAILEVERVLRDLAASGKYRLSDDAIDSVVTLLKKDAVLVSGQMEAKGAIPEDPDDEKFLSIALEGEAKVIISGDRHLLKLARFRDITIQTAREFIDSFLSDASE
ncbi:MAG: putative toxin-antitoxin system toxin component, PIN family [Chloroflexi bacterium]|nr:putative toxin-antitoxin system toxin component, PIN family [Chloroflexota bacterium]